MRLNPAYGAGLDPQSEMFFRMSKSAFTARYAQHIEQRSEYGLTKMSKVDPERDQWSDYDGYYDDNAIFNRGYPW